MRNGGSYTTVLYRGGGSVGTVERGACKYRQCGIRARVSSRHYSGSTQGRPITPTEEYKTTTQQVGSCFVQDDFLFLLNYVKREQVEAQVRHKGYIVKGDRVISPAVEYQVEFSNKLHLPNRTITQDDP